MDILRSRVLAPTRERKQPRFPTAYLLHNQVHLLIQDVIRDVY